MITEKVNTEFVELSGKKFQKEKNERQIKKEMVNRNSFELSGE